MLSSFKTRIKRSEYSKEHKITASLGMREAFRYYTKKSKALNEHTFRRVIRYINNALQEHLATGEDINLPCRMGKLELRKFKTKVSFKDGKIITNLPIDWDETLNLWYEDEDALRRKVKVRMEVPEVFRIFYKKNSANYKNKTFFTFQANRGLKQKLKTNIKNKKVDAFLVN
jgi:nucleoid DNA-binding protein